MRANVRDSPYSWVVALATSFTYFIMYGMGRVSGWLFVETLTQFNVDRSTASFPFTLGSALTFLVGPLAGYLAHKIGIRYVIFLGCFFASIGTGSCFFAENIIALRVSWGVMYGLGAGLACALLPQINNLYFERHLVKATGIAYAGCSIAGFVLPPITEMLLKQYGIAGTYLLLCGITLHALPAAILLKSPIPEGVRAKENIKYRKNNTVEKNSYDLHTVNFSKEHGTTGIYCITKESSINFLNNTSNFPNSKGGLYVETSDMSRNKVQKRNFSLNEFSVLWDPLFLVICFTTSIIAFFCFVLPAILADYSRDKGLSMTRSTHLMIAFSIADTVGRLALGWVTDSKYMTRNNFCALCFLIVAACFAFLVWSKGFLLMAVFLILIGLCFGALSPLKSGVMCEYIEKEKQTMALASYDIFCVPLLLSTSYLIGYFRDELGSYNGLIYILCAVAIASSALMLFLPCIKRLTQKETVFCNK